MNLNYFDITRGIDEFYASNVRVKPLQEVEEINWSNIDHISQWDVGRLTLPSRQIVRSQSSKTCANSCEKSMEEKEPRNKNRKNIVACVQVKPNTVEHSSFISQSAINGLQSKLDYGAVKLKKVEFKSSHPCLMLIRVKGEKYVDVRLVAPKYTSIHCDASFVLLTPSRLFTYYGKNSNILEKTKAVYIAKVIRASNGMLDCYAKIDENVNENSNNEGFWSLLGYNLDHEPCTTTLGGHENEPFEKTIAKLNAAYKIVDNSPLFTVMTSEIPSRKLLHDPTSIVVFDFASEIYVWTGSLANRSSIQSACTFAKNLRCQGLDAAFDYQLLLGDEFEHSRPEWCLLLKISQGLIDVLLQSKFYDWDHQRKVVTSKITLHGNPENTVEIQKIADFDEQANSLGRSMASMTESVEPLTFEDTELHRDAKNIFTEKVTYFIFNGGTDLLEIDDLWLFQMDTCYVVKWQYRVERIGVRKLDGTEREHETGRPRIAFFYWMGSKTSKKLQGLCAMALRDFDKERHPHERVMQGQEPHIFLQIFNGGMVIAGENTGVFLLHTSSIRSECFLEEMCAPVVLRSHAIYALINVDHVYVWYRDSSQKEFADMASKLATKVTNFNHPDLNLIMKKPNLADPVEKESYNNLPVIAAEKWIKAPQLIRLYENQAYKLTTYHHDEQSAFSFKQESMVDTTIVDQGTHLWVWCESVASTSTLNFAKAYWEDRNGPMTVISKGFEPDSFKALFSKWIEYEIESPEDAIQKPVEVNDLLQIRNQSWSIGKLLSRDLPPGIDKTKLETYLADDDFRIVFHMDREQFYSLPPWKQIEMRKKNKLF